MKKAFAFLFAVAAMAAVSCNKETQEIETPESELFPMTFTATTSETRTLLDQDHVTVNWLASDKISVFDGVGNQQFATDGTGATVQFTGSAAAASTYFALYPYNANASLIGTSVVTTLPSFQTAVKGSFIDGLNINAAQSSSTTFVFDNVLSVAKITVDNSKLGGKRLKAIKLSSTDYPLAGDVNVSFGTTCTAAGGTNTVKEVVLVGGANGLADGDYYLMVLPNQGGEIKLTFYSTDEYTASKTATLTKPFTAGIIKNLGTAQGLTWNAGGWKLVTDASTLRAGDKLVIASNAKGKVASSLSSDFLSEVSATFSQDYSTITSLPGTAMQFTLGGTSSAWTLTSSAGQLYCSTVKKLNFSSNGTGTWAISISDGNATIQSTESSYGRFLHNVNSKRFTTYTSNTTTAMLLPQLYRQTGGGDPLVIPASSVAAPTFNPAGGTYSDAQNVTISTTSADASIFYTTGNSDFSAGDWLPYSTPVNVAASCTLKAIAVKDGMVSSVSSANYSIGVQEHTATIVFGNGGTKISSASVTGDDSQGNTWTVTTVGTTSFTQHSDCSQVGSKDSPATSITFSTTLNSSASVKNMSAKFGGYASTAGTIKLKVDNTEIGSGSLNGANDVTVTSTTTASGTVLSVTVTGIARGVKVYNISVTYSN